jgi:hypothetical protein
LRSCRRCRGLLGSDIGAPGAEAVLGASIGDGSSPTSSLEVTAAVLSKGCLGAKIDDGSSPTRSLEVTEAVLGASIGDGSSPMRSLEVTEAVLGALEDGCPVEVGSSPVAVVSKDPELSIPMNAQTTSVVLMSAQTSSIPSPASSSLVSKVPIKKKGSLGRRIV